MSALASQQNSFSAHLALAADVAVSITASTLADLQAVVAKLQPPANDAAVGGAASPAPRPAKETKAATPAATPSPTPAPTSAPATAPAAASGSGSSDDEKRPTYDDVKARVLALTKVSRETCVNALAKFGVDHATKLKLEDYAAFIAHADEQLKVPA